MYSTRLWRHFTHAEVVIQIVYTEAEVPEELTHYAQDLRLIGAHVELVPSGAMECVLKAQLIRVLAFTLPMVRIETFIIINGTQHGLLSTDRSARTISW